MQDSPNTPEDRPKAKPPYFILIPVALGLIGFIGFQTVRISSDAHTDQSPYAVDTSVAQSVVNHGVITVHARPRTGSRPVTVALAQAKKPEPSPSPAASASAPPSAAPKPSPSHAAKPQEVAQAPKPAHAAHNDIADDAIAKDPVPHIAHTAEARVAATVTTTIAAPAGAAQPQPQVQAASDSGTTPPITDAPVVRKVVREAATAKPVQVAVAQAPAQPATINASDRIVEARMTYAATPDYPDIARDQGARGTSVVFVTVDPIGSIVHMSIATSSGNPSLDRAALSAARSSRYVAPKVDGKPATETYRVTYDFSP